MNPPETVKDPVRRGDQNPRAREREDLRLEFFTGALNKRPPKRPELDELNHLLEFLSAPEILKWTWATFGPDVVATSSFQTQSLPLLHMIAEVAPRMPVVFLDTGFHFQETLAFRDSVQRDLGLLVQEVTARGGHHGFLARFGELYRTNPDMCCYLNKVEPMERALGSARAWVTGIRRDQTGSRATIPILSHWRSRVLKVCPFARWTRDDVAEYRRRHRLPEHPLDALGYRSVGCSPCTRPVHGDEQEREGRWSGTSKTECGLHVRDPQNPEEG